MRITAAPSPNFDSREGQEIDMLVMHYTGMRSGDAALDRLRDETAKVSAHYLIHENGEICKLVEEENRAWHAGVSFWRGNTNINRRSVGIEIVNKGHEFGYTPFPEVQMQAVAELSLEIISRHNIPARNIVAHSDIAPTRKQDPGELFDWKYLAARGIGLFPSPTPPSVIRHPSSALTAYGYDISNEQAAAIAFQRHFRPDNLSGEWDDECAKLLAALLAML